MRKFLLSTIALSVLTALTGPALAGDLPSRKAAPAYATTASTFSWTGFYVGLEGGADFIGNRFATSGGGHVGNSHTAGLIGGIVGYNYELANRFVLGLEGDAGAVLGGSHTRAYAGNSYSADNSYFADIRGRLGYAIFDRTLLYVAGGVATPSATYTNDAVGWTAGAGLDYALTHNLIGRVEYRYTDLGRSYSTALGGRTSQDSNAVLVGLLYKFGQSDAPVVAKY
jgi:outer membrane immunogenic protein